MKKQRTPAQKAATKRMLEARAKGGGMRGPSSGGKRAKNPVDGKKAGERFAAGRTAAARGEARMKAEVKKLEKAADDLKKTAEKAEKKIETATKAATKEVKVATNAKKSGGKKKSGGGKKKAAKKPAASTSTPTTAKKSSGGKRKGGAKKAHKKPPLKGNRDIKWENKAAKSRTSKARKAENATRKRNPTLSWSQLAVGGIVGGLSFAAAALVDRGVATMGDATHKDPFYGAEAAERIGVRAGVKRIGVQVGAAGLSAGAAYLLRKYKWPATIFSSMALGFAGHAVFQLLIEQAIPRLLDYAAPDGYAQRMLPEFNPDTQTALEVKLGLAGAPRQLQRQGAGQPQAQQQRRAPFASAGTAGTPGVAGAGCKAGCACGTCARKIGIPEGHQAQRGVDAQGRMVFTMVPMAGVARPPAQQKPAGVAAPQAVRPAPAPAPVADTSAEDAAATELAMRAAGIFPKAARSA